MLSSRVNLSQAIGAVPRRILVPPKLLLCWFGSEGERHRMRVRAQPIHCPRRLTSASTLGRRSPALEPPSSSISGCGRYDSRTETTQVQPSVRGGFQPSSPNQDKLGDIRRRLAGLSSLPSSPQPPDHWIPPGDQTRFVTSPQSGNTTINLRWEALLIANARSTAFSFLRIG